MLLCKPALRNDLKLYAVILGLYQHKFANREPLHHVRYLETVDRAAVAPHDLVDIAADDFGNSERWISRYAFSRKPAHVAGSIANHRHRVGVEFRYQDR